MRFEIYTSSFPKVIIGKKRAHVQMILLSRRPNSRTLISKIGIISQYKYSRSLKHVKRCFVVK